MYNIHKNNNHKLNNKTIHLITNWIIFKINNNNNNHQLIIIKITLLTWITNLLQTMKI